jgi:hypothetical protein
MTAAERKAKITEITGGNYFSTDGKGKRIRYCGEVKTFIEYEIPMDLIIYNVENGRIASLVKSYEREHSSLNPEKEEDAKQIAQFLYDSNDIANKKTKRNIVANGQLETGIITCDGVLVDGNRRVSLMRQIISDSSFSTSERARCEKFRAIVLPEDADKKEILRLETTFQMGADEKVGYNAIEKYLHAQDLSDQGFSTSDISEFMNLDGATEVTKLLEIKQLIDEYLEYFGLDGLYTRLPKGFEDDLQKLNTAIRKIKNGSINWIPTTRLTEVENDLKCISFDYIRLNAKSPDGFEFRSIASTSNANFLVNEDIWNQFVKSWQDATNDITETPIEVVLSKATTTNESSRLLEARDNEWRTNVKDNLMEAFNDAQTTLNNKKEKEKPGVLFKRALNALQQIDLENLGAATDKSDILKYIEQVKIICDNVSNKVQ